MADEELVKILSGEELENEQGSYLNLTIEGSKGPYKKYCFNPAAEGWKGPGMYRIGWIAKGKYKNIKTMEKAPDSAAPSPGPSFSAPYQGNGRSGSTDKSIQSQVAVKSAADITCALIEKDILKDTERVADFSCDLANSFMLLMSESTEPKPEKTKAMEAA